MTGEQSLLPRIDLGYPFVQQEQWRDTPKEHDSQKDDDQAPRRDAQFGRVEHIERHPCTDIYEAATVEHEINDRREDFVFNLGIEVAVPADRRPWIRGVSNRR